MNSCKITGLDRAEDLRVYFISEGKCVLAGESWTCNDKGTHGFDQADNELVFIPWTAIAYVAQR